MASRGAKQGDTTPPRNNPRSQKGPAAEGAALNIQVARMPRLIQHKSVWGGLEWGGMGWCGVEWGGVEWSGEGWVGVAWGGQGAGGRQKH